MPESDSAEATDVGGPVAPETVSPDDPGAAEMPLEQLPGTLRPALPSSEDLPVPWGALSDHEDTGVLGGTGVQERKGPCRRELYRVLGRLAREQRKVGDGPYRFYLPNCSKNGFYHSKQCETSLDGEAGLCWCVDPWSGRRIPGSVGVRGDPNCQQYFH